MASRMTLCVAVRDGDCRIERIDEPIHGAAMHVAVHELGDEVGRESDDKRLDSIAIRRSTSPLLSQLERAQKHCLVTERCQHSTSYPTGTHQATDIGNDGHETNCG